MAVVGKATVSFDSFFDAIKKAAREPLKQWEGAGREAGAAAADRTGAGADPVLQKFREDSALRAANLASKNILAGIGDPLKTRMRVQGAYTGDDIGEAIVQGAVETLESEDWLSSPGMQQVIGEARGERDRDIEWDFIPSRRKDENEEIANQQAAAPAGPSGRADSGGRSIGQRFTEQWDRHFRSRSGAPYEQLIKTTLQKFTEFQVMQGLMVGGASTIMAAVNGLIAFAAGVGHAMFGLAAIGNIFGSMIQGLMVGKSLFKGVGAAIKAHEKVVKKAVTSALDAAQQAMRVARARFNLKKETLQYGRAASDAFRKAERAERRYIKSLEKEKKARERLEEARKRAAERIEDTKLAMEGAGLSEERTVLNLKKAEEALQSARSGGTADEIYEADLAYREQELQLRQIREANADLFIESQKVYAKGVDNDDAVLDGIEAVDQAARDAADALREAIRATEDIPLSIESASLQLQGAMLALQKALQPPNQTALDGLADAMDELSPAAQRFVRFWVDKMQPMFKDMRQAGQEAFFPGLQRGLQAMVKGGFFGVVKDMVTGTSRALGGFFEGMGSALAEPENLGMLNSIFGSNTGIIASIGRMVTSMVKPLLQLGAAVAPYAERMAGRWADAAERFSDFIEEADTSGDLDTFLGNAERRLLALKEMFKAFGPGLKEVIVAAGSAADIFIAGVTKMGEEWSITVIENGRAKTTKTFEDAVSNFLKILDAAGALGGFAFRMGNLPGLNELFVGTGENLPFLMDVLDVVLEDFTDDIINVIHALGDFSKALTSSQTVNMFAEVVSRTFAIVGAIVSWGPVLALVATYLTVKGVTKGLSFALGFFDSVKESLRKLKGFKDDWRSVFRAPEPERITEAGKGQADLMVAMFEGRGAKLSREFTPKFKKAGTDFTGGILVSLRAGIDRVIEAARVLGVEALRSFRDFLEIRSPSGVAMDEAQDVVDLLFNEIVNASLPNMKGLGTVLDIDTAGAGTAMVGEGFTAGVAEASPVLETTTLRVTDEVSAALEVPSKQAGANMVQAFADGQVESSASILKTAGDFGEVDSIVTDESTKRASVNAARTGHRDWLKAKYSHMKNWISTALRMGTSKMKAMIGKAGNVLKAVGALIRGAWKWLFALIMKWAAAAAVAGQGFRKLLKNALLHGGRKFPLPRAVKEALEKKLGKDVMEKGILKSVGSLFRKKAIDLVEKKFGKALAAKVALALSGYVGGPAGIVTTIASILWTVADAAILIKDLWSLWREIQDQKEITDEELNNEYIDDDIIQSFTDDYEYGELSDDLGDYIAYAMGGPVEKMNRHYRVVLDAERQNYYRSKFRKPQTVRRNTSRGAASNFAEGAPTRNAARRLAGKIHGAVHGGQIIVNRMESLVARMKALPAHERRRGVQRFAYGGLVKGLNIPPWLLGPSGPWHYDANLNDIALPAEWSASEVKRLLEKLYEKEKFAFLKNSEHKDLFEKALDDAVKGQEASVKAQKDAVKAAMDVKRAQMAFDRYNLGPVVNPVMADFSSVLAGGGMSDFLAMTQEAKHDAMGQIITATGGNLGAARAEANYIQLTAELEEAVWVAYTNAYTARMEERRKEKEEAERLAREAAAPPSPPGGPDPPPPVPQTAQEAYDNLNRGKQELWYYPFPKTYRESTYPDHKPTGSVDMSAPQGTDILPVRSGTVTKAVNNITNISQRPKGAFGNYVKIYHPDVQMTSLYAHMFSEKEKGLRGVSVWRAVNMPTVGTKVNSWTRIGKVGQSGNTAGAHLHLTMYQVDSRGQEWSVDVHKFLKNKGVKMHNAHPLEEGGIVRATPGGLQVLIGEAGRNERVDPLDAHGHAEAGAWIARALEILADDGEFDIHMENHIHQSVKPDIPVLAERFSREVMFIR